MVICSKKKVVWGHLKKIRMNNKKVTTRGGKGKVGKPSKFLLGSGNTSIC